MGKDKSVFQLTLGPKQYIQQGPNGFWGILVSSYDDSIIIMGHPFFSSFYIVLDRDLGTISFQLGCGSDVR